MQLKTINVACCKFLLLVGLLCCGCAPSGPPRFEVTGTVLVDGQPAERVLVQLQHENPQVEGNDRYPVGMTDASGNFRIGEGDIAAGVVEGTYRVTFSWLSSAGLDAVDQLQGRYADATKSNFSLSTSDTKPHRFELKTK